MEGTPFGRSGKGYHYNLGMDEHLVEGVPGRPEPGRARGPRWRKADRNVSVGLVCDTMAIEHAFAAGISEFDFLAGTSLHKCRLAKQSHTIITLRIGKPTWKETAYRGAWKLKKKASSLVHGKKIQILG